MPRFSLFTDANVDGRLIRGLRQSGWEIERAVDNFPQDENDDVLFEHAAKENLVFVTNDEDLLASTVSWLEENRSYRMIYWEKKASRPGEHRHFPRQVRKTRRRRRPFLLFHPLPEPLTDFHGLPFPDHRYDAGVEVQFLTLVWNLPFRVEYGFNLDPVFDEDKGRFFVTLAVRF